MPQRVVSLAPSATETMRYFDVQDRLVATTDHCDGPEPTVGGWLTPDVDTVAAMEPDLLLTSDPLQRDLVDELRADGYSVTHCEPRTLPDVFATMQTIGDVLEIPERAERHVATLRDRLERVQAAVGEQGRPTVYCEEWGEPPMAAGNWVPDAVDAAGGHYPFLDPGERSREVSPDRVAAAAPDHVILHHCGAGPHGDPAVLEERDWSLQGATVTVLDDSLLNQPSPKLIEGIERLAKILHPPCMLDSTPPSGD